MSSAPGGDLGPHSSQNEHKGVGQNFHDMQDVLQGKL